MSIQYQNGKPGGTNSIQRMLSQGIQLQYSLGGGGGDGRGGWGGGCKKKVFPDFNFLACKLVKNILWFD